MSTIHGQKYRSRSSLLGAGAVVEEVTYQMRRRAGELPEEEITTSACRVPDYVSPETRGQWPYSRSAARVLKMEQTWVRHDLYLLQCPEYILV